MIDFSLRSRRHLACVVVATFAANCMPVFAQSRSMEGRIVRFECGDNCYLTIIDKRNKEHTGLCIAPECETWNEEVSMPSQYKGRHVAVTLGRGVQLDAAGNVMGKMMAFEKIKFLE